MFDRKRIFALMLAVCLLVSVLPLPALAEEPVYYCGLHEHQESCHGPLLICTQNHDHEDGCYSDKYTTLVCGQEEDHTHAESCLAEPQEEPECSCQSLCGETANGDCGICKDTPDQCGYVEQCATHSQPKAACTGCQEEQEARLEELTAQLDEMIDALPTVEEASQLTQEEKLALYNGDFMAVSDFAEENGLTPTEEQQEFLAALDAELNKPAATSAPIVSLYVNGVALVENSAVTTNTVTGVSYNATTNTLTLNGANITSGYAYSSTTTAGVYASGNLNIILEGTNTIGDGGKSLTHGISVAGDLVISGSGSVTAYGKNNGIVANGEAFSLTIKSGSISAYGEKAGLRGGLNVTIEEGTVLAQSTASGKFGILADKGSLTISGGNVTASNTDSVQGYGMKGTAGIVISGGTVSANGKTNDLFSTTGTIDIYEGDATVTVANCSPTATMITKVNLTLNANDTDSPVTVTMRIIKDRETSLPANTFTRENHIFKNWSTAADGSGTSYTDGQAVTLSADTILYAQWIATSGYCGADADGKNAQWKVTPNADGTTYTLTISGTGATADYSSASAVPWYTPFGANITTGIVEEGITRLGNRAFVLQPKLTEVSLPSTLKEIGVSAFNQTASLTSITLPNGLERIDENAFWHGSLAGKLVIPDTVTYIGNTAFDQNQLTEVVLSQNLTTISSGFKANPLAQMPEIPASLTNLSSAFMSCTSLTDVVIPAHVTTLGATFSGCTALTTATIKAPDTIAFSYSNDNIGAFSGCSSLKVLVLESQNISITSASTKHFTNLADGSVIYIINPDDVSTVQSCYTSAKTSIAVTDGGTFATTPAADSLGTPKKAGSLFAGWWTKNASGEFETELTGTPVSGTVYYAKWEEKATPNFTLTADKSSYPYAADAAVTLTATVAATKSKAAAPNTVDFYQEGVTEKLGTASLENGAYCLTLTGLDVGEYTFWAKFGGDDTFKPVTKSNEVKVAVVKADPAQSYVRFEGLTEQENVVLVDSLDEGILISASVDDVQGAAVTYSSSNPGVAAVDPATGEVTVKAAGTTVITATASSTNYEDSTDTYDLTIVHDGTYKIIEGAGQSFQQGKEAAFVSNADFDKRVGVRVDGTWLEPDSYTEASGSTKITLTKGYTKTLSTGKHTLTIVSNDGASSTEFTVTVPAAAASTASGYDTDSPRTGDTTNRKLWYALAIIGLLGFAATTIGRKYLFRNR